MSSLLAFLFNLADWTVTKDKICLEKPDMCYFLEHIIERLLSRPGQTYQSSFKKAKVYWPVHPQQSPTYHSQVYRGYKSP